MKKTLLALGVLVLLGVSITTVYNYKKSLSNIPSTNTSSSNKTTSENSKIKAIDFKLKALNGKEVSLSDYKGKKIFLNFWASWCPPCKAEMPEMEKLYKQTKDSDLVILAVNLAEDKSTVQKFITSNKYNFPVLLDSDNSVAIKYQVASIPTSYFIDKDGNIVAKHIGSMTLENMKSYIDNIN